MEMRIARAVDIVKRTRYVCPDHFTGTVIEKDGEFMGMGWIIWGSEDRPYVFFEASEEGLKYKMHILRWSIRFLNAAKRVEDELYTIEDETEPSAPKWIDWLGFKDTGEKVKGHRVLKWQRQQ